MGPPQGHVLLQLRGALLLLALLLLRHGRAALSSELSMEAPLGLGAVAASSDSANSWTATMPLGLGSWGLGRGEPGFAVSTVSTSPCADAACLRSSEITGHRCAGWPRGGLRAVVDLLLLGRLLAAPATATAVGAAPAPPGPPSGLASQLLLPWLLPWVPLLLLRCVAPPLLPAPGQLRPPACLCTEIDLGQCECLIFQDATRSFAARGARTWAACSVAVLAGGANRLCCAFCSILEDATRSFAARGGRTWAGCSVAAQGPQQLPRL